MSDYGVAWWRDRQGGGAEERWECLVRFKRSRPRDVRSLGLRSFLACGRCVWLFQPVAFAGGYVDDRLIGRLGLHLGVEHQRQLCRTPRAAIVDAPEGHAVDVFCMPIEDVEQPGV